MVGPWPPLPLSRPLWYLVVLGRSSGILRVIRPWVNTATKRLQPTFNGRKTGDNVWANGNVTITGTVAATNVHTSIIMRSVKPP